MAIINTRIITGPLNAFTANPDLLDTALGREEVLHACAEVVNGLASALATVDEKICPPSMFPSRQRLDRRWATVSARLDDASRTAGTLAYHLLEAARRAGQVITDGETVRYWGSLHEQHGLYLLRGYCSCDKCEGLALHRGPNGAELVCVNPSSIAAVQSCDWQPLHTAHAAAHVLDTQPRDLPAPLEVEHAITILRGLSTITSRARTALGTWHEPIAARFGRRCLINPSGDNGRLLVRLTLETLDRIGPDLTTVRRHLRTAMGILVEIQEATTRAGRQVA